MCAMAGAQTAPQQPELQRRPQTQTNEQSNDQGSSSSRSTKIDAGPPIGDAGDHPYSNVRDLTGDTGEVHAWDPHRADKDVEVAEYHFKRKNYRAAEDRYREALYFQDNHAAAMFGLAETLEKENKKQEAVSFYTKYLKTLPNGPKAADAKKALERLNAPIPQVYGAGAPPPPPTQLYEKKRFKERAKDAVPAGVCVGAACTHSKPAPPSDTAPQPK
jgi:tetratricopeptide (TPR) repeat protein